MHRIIYLVLTLFISSLVGSELKEKNTILTQEEISYLEKNKFKALTTVSWVPFNYESKDGQISGISVAYLRLIAKKIGMKIDIEKAGNFSDVLSNIKFKTTDMTMSATQTANRNDYAIFSKPYESFPIAIAVKSDKEFIQKTSVLEGKKVAVGRNYSSYRLLKERYPLIEFVQVDNINEAIELVDDEEVFAAIDILPALQQSILSNNHVEGVKIGGITDVDFKLQIMLRDDLKDLHVIINKAIDSISSEDRNEIYKGWITGKEITRFDYEFVYKLAFIFLMAILIIIFWNNKLRQEVNRRKEAEDIIIQEKEKLSNILSLIPVPILITNMDTKEIVFANKYSKKQYRIPEDEEIVGKKIDFLYTTSTQREDILAAMDDNNCLNEYETRYKLQNGEEIDALLSTIPITYNQQNAVLGTITDITNIKAFQKELENQRNIADAATKAMSDFLANMSHEIRTPLNAILGFIDILKERVDGKENLKYLNIIDKSSNSLLGVINDILDFSKIQNGKIELEYIDFDPKDEFKSMAYLFDARAKEKKINFEVDIESLPNTLNSDILRIKQVILNLLSNAMKFTPEGKTVRLSIRYDNESLSVSIKDEGIGICDSKLSTIFESFSQENSSTTRKYGGTGLGLSISKELVILLKGDLQVKSTIGLGSEFYFSIPAKLGDKIKQTKPVSKTLQFDQQKVLLVEDNHANQMFMKVILKKMNLSFDIAGDGLDAVEMFKKEKYDIILMDENMPNMNGIEAAQIILELEKEDHLTHTPIVALTANALKGDRERFLEAGMDDYLTKPVNKIKLANVIEELIND